MLILNHGQGTTVRKFTDMGMSDVPLLISFIRLVSGCHTVSVCDCLIVSLTVCQNLENMAMARYVNRQRR